LVPPQQEVINTPVSKHQSDADLREATTNHDDALAVIRPITDALNHIPPLCAEIRDLRRRHAGSLFDLSDLVAAGLATLGADADGEPDALYYLRDELRALGYLPGDPEHPHAGERP
jgi:hypothetical protein